MAVGPQRCYPSPLRYPGGKGKVANYLKLVFLKNGLLDHQYAELYAGGASVALTLLYEEYASQIHINDLNRGIYAFWDAVLNHTEHLCRLVQDTPVTIEEWERQRMIQADADAVPLALGFSTFFLNRTNRSGIITGGIIGGRQQTGKWKLDARYNKPELIRRIQKVARFRSRITLTGMDAADYLRQVLPRLPQRTLPYLDPPYYHKGAGLYQNFYEHEDHVVVADLIRRSGKPWIVSYDAAPEVLALYSAARRVIYGLHYSASLRYRGAEVIFFSPMLEPPVVGSPANIQARTVDRVRRLGLQAT